jgi:hypothetical protein
MCSTTAHAAAADAQRKGRSNAFILKREHLWALIPLAVAWFAASIDFIEPFDFWWNVKSGEIMAHTGRFLATDVLVYTPVREPYANPQWGSQLLFYWLYSITPYLLLTLRAVIMTGVVALLIWLCTWRSGSLRAGAVAALVAYMTGWTNYGMRPQLLAFIPFVLFVVLLERRDAHPRWLPLLVPVMMFWVNVHGSFFLGVALLGIYGLGTLIERAGSADGRAWLRSRAALWQAGWFIAAGCASLANPYLVGIYRYFFAATNDPIARSLNMEWQGPTLYEGTGQLFFLQVAVFLASLYLSRRRLRPTEILLVLAFGYLALTSLRNVLWWAWVTAPIMAANFAAWAELRRAARPAPAAEADDAGEEATPARNAEMPLLNWIFVGMLAGGALLFTPLWRPVNPLVPEASKGYLAGNTPTEVAEYVRTERPPAPVFNYMEWGGYLEWELYPRYQMFIDGRFEAREVEVWNDYLAVFRARADWAEVLDRYGVNTLVLNKTAMPSLVRFVWASPEWSKSYEDEMGVVFVRR